MITTLLMIGCGDIGIRLANELSSDELNQELLLKKDSVSTAIPVDNFKRKKALNLYGLRRHIDQLPETIQGIACDLNTINDLKECFHEAGNQFDIVVITLVPNERSDEGYQQAYVDNLEKIINALESLSSTPQRIFLVSSTSVYGQQDGQWVDEDSMTEPNHYSGCRVLQGERRLAQSSIPSTVIRFSGIYGPGRLRIIQQVKNGDWEPDSINKNVESGYSNRIHADDCAGVLAHLIKKQLREEPLENRYLATDCEPVRLNEVKQWIAKQLGITKTLHNAEATAIGKVKQETVMRRNSKRCSNKRLLESGYQFQYPTFREGYGQVIKGPE